MKNIIFLLSIIVTCIMVSCVSDVDSNSEVTEVTLEAEQELKCLDPECYRNCSDYCHSYPAYDCGYGGCWRQCCEH